MKNLSRFELGLLIAAVIVALIGGGAAYYLSTQLDQAQTDLASAQGTFSGLVTKQAYNPSTTNIKTLQDNEALLKTNIEPLIAQRFKSSDNKIYQVQNTPSISWKIDLDNRVKNLQALAKQNYVKLPPNFYFGFSRYLSQNPRDDVTGALSKELIYIEQINLILINAHVQAINGVRRTYDEDENPLASADMLPGKITTSPDGAYLCHSFAIEFEAQTDALRQALNNLNDSPYVFIIRSVTMTNSQKEVPRLPDLDRMAAAVPDAASIAPVQPLTDQSPGAASANNPPPTRPTVGPQYLFGSEYIKVHLVLDAVEWQGLVPLVTQKKVAP